MLKISLKTESNSKGSFVLLVLLKLPHPNEPLVNGKWNLTLTSVPHPKTGLVNTWHSGTISICSYIPSTVSPANTCTRGCKMAWDDMEAPLPPEPMWVELDQNEPVLEP